ncbi:hypothetical protein TorRG33x02_079660 [Trema orientale]|uniref:Transmembrane protein n=1 Tax=Trema orientale TaxID=63057 RepID=A0A2P5FF06_TREOI|nr:hypothetical protein TorRG33x02_079660 [Trema orientale]
MGRRCFPTILLVSFFVLLFFSHGFGRRSLKTVEGHQEESYSSVEVKENGGVKSREMIEVTDYSEPEPNTNPRAGYIFTPPPSSG